MKSFLKITLFTLSVFLISDFILGNLIYKKLIKKRSQQTDTSFALRDKIFDHKFKPNSKSFINWGDRSYYLCTDTNGFRVTCDKRNQSEREFDIAFLGDSFTEPVGVDYKNSFVNLFSEKNTNLKVANLAISSYSPSIYYSKINFLINKGYKFKNVALFIDQSDFVDDVLCYELKKNVIERKKTYSKCFENKNNIEMRFENFFSNNFKMTNELIKKTGLNKKFYKIPENVINNSRASWTYDYNKNNFNDLEYEQSLNIVLENMYKLSSLMKKNKINLYLFVYPWPGTLANDEKINKHSQIWETFCKTNCKSFFNLNKIFLIQKNKIGFKETYKKYYIVNDVHFNKKGHSLIAEFMINNFKINKN
ncbi:MAG: hypothetical protein CBD76_02815 [Pelagibacteraceae bacterium TMED216]|nr:MAG: hypothetical protein CBD76_02815 [Pelagibacteraceae bacterium TMED216]|tara:strand:+ start:8871 stop:9962 length:1092 start_codon:yes stop_codon:yes gene_type:complete